MFAIAALALLLVACQKTAAPEQPAPEVLEPETAPEQPPTPPAEEPVAPPVAEETPPAMEEESTEEPVEAMTEGSVVEVSSSGFSPAELKITAGTMVTFKNAAETNVALTPQTKGINDLRKTFGPGETFEYTFKDAGEYVVFNAIHKRRMTVMVE